MYKIIILIFMSSSAVFAQQKIILPEVSNKMEVSFADELFQEVAESFLGYDYFEQKCLRLKKKECLFENTIKYPHFSKEKINITTTIKFLDKEKFIQVSFGELKDHIIVHKKKDGSYVFRINGMNPLLEIGANQRGNPEYLIVDKTQAKRMSSLLSSQSDQAYCESIAPSLKLLDVFEARLFAALDHLKDEHQTLFFDKVAKALNSVRTEVSEMEQRIICERFGI